MFDGDSSIPKMRIEGTLAYSSVEPLTINGIDLEIAGEITGVDDFSVGNVSTGGIKLYAHTWAHDSNNIYNFICKS